MQPGFKDTLSMFEAATSMPEQLSDAMRAAEAVEYSSDGRFENVVVAGMGGSGIAGDILAAIGGELMSIPVVVCKSPQLPLFVGPGSLVFLLSFSGDTEETLRAAERAYSSGAQVVVVSRGGHLGELAESRGTPFVRVPEGIPQPRAGLGALLAPLVIITDQLGILPGGAGLLTDAVEQLSKRKEEISSEGNLALEVAKAVVGKVVVVYGSGSLGAVAAQRWKTQINENAKAPAFYNSYPELCHNEVAGWSSLGNLTRSSIAVVNLRHGYEYENIDRRVELVNQIVAPEVDKVVEVCAEGRGVLAQLLDLIFIGDVASLYVASLLGVDPGPVAVLDEIKLALRSS
ncbi:MAG: bifunctional phosphoglucose/phosphomannose isomerase [Actinobacteria bacterium]|jgi:glucose/mannose-6-phosphate isomerase|nr:bifunctional phosphoglucose/phosphomannose isomerase [Actinomycetota bacterium]MCL6094983.1 bifunctional phosphoglucose/phosphomannose isomerase [Actinomycetota bacterium]